MNKKVILIHRILFFANVFILAASLVYYLIKWDQLPDEIGVHFSGDGSFDVFDKKIFGFYPHIVGGAAIAGVAVADRFIKKINSGLKLTEKGEMLFRSELLLNVDIFLFLFTSLFTAWTYSVANQVPLPLDILFKIWGITLLAVFAGIILQIVICIKHRKKKAELKTAEKGTFHKVSRLIAWLLAFGEVLVMALGYAMEPIEGGKFYFVDLGVWLDKRLLFLLPAIAVVTQVVFGIISVRVAKAEKAELLMLTDRLRAVCAVFFFWWELIIMSSDNIGIISVSLFTLLCAASIIIYVKKTRAEKLSDSQ